MAHIPPMAAATRLIQWLVSARLVHLHSGKTRELFTLPDHPDLLLLVTTDRISIFDFVLAALVPGKGEILTAMVVFWLTQVFSDIDHHLVAYGHGIDQYLPADLRGQDLLHRRALVIKKFGTPDFEAVVRGYLTGSGWKDYQKDGRVCGHILPAGLSDGSRLPEPIFTPSTKAADGHDLPIDIEEFRGRPDGRAVEAIALTFYKRAAEYALRRMIILADTKIELAPDGTVIDEVLTPDSSRFWLLSDWETAQSIGRAPQGFDKQFIREWGKRVKTPFVNASNTAIVGIDCLEPTNTEHRSFVGGLEVPDVILDKTTTLYHECFCRLTGQTLHFFQKANGMIG